MIPHTTTECSQVAGLIQRSVEAPRKHHLFVQLPFVQLPFVQLSFVQGSLPSALARGSEWGIYSRDVRMYIRTYVLVTLRYVNWQYRLGMSIWAHTRAQELICCLICALFAMSVWRFLATEDGEDSSAGPSQVHILWSQVHKRMQNAANGCWL